MNCEYGLKTVVYVIVLDVPTSLSVYLHPKYPPLDENFNQTLIDHCLRGQSSLS